MSLNQSLIKVFQHRLLKFPWTIWDKWGYILRFRKLCLKSILYIKTFSERDSVGV